MPKDTHYTNYPRALVGVASVSPGTSAPSAGIKIGANGGLTVACDTCGLYLPAHASHQDVVSHPCYRGFSIAITNGQIVLS